MKVPLSQENDATRGRWNIQIMYFVVAILPSSLIKSRQWPREKKQDFSFTPSCIISSIKFGYDTKKNSVKSDTVWKQNKQNAQKLTVIMTTFLQS